jgi:hypothetical protein
MGGLNMDHVIAFVLGFLFVAAGPLSPFGVMLICVALFVGGCWAIVALPYYLEPVFVRIDRLPNRVLIPLCFTGPLWVFGFLYLIAWLHG